MFLCVAFHILASHVLVGVWFSITVGSWFDFSYAGSKCKLYLLETIKCKCRDEVADDKISLSGSVNVSHLYPQLYDYVFNTHILSCNPHNRNPFLPQWFSSHLLFIKWITSSECSV